MTTPRQTATKMAEAAQAWLERLDDAQRPTAQWAGPADDVSEAERRRWFYTPTDHGGLSLHQQRPAQQRAAMTLVAAGLSLAGYVTVATIMGLENILDRTSSAPRATPAPGATGSAATTYRSTTSWSTAS
jgi:hypothetical protein